MSVKLEAKAQLSHALPHKLTSLPILLLNMHENCNCRCLMCDIWKRPPGLGLDLASFRHHRDSIMALGVQQVVLTGGEPLLHSNFEALCSFLKSCGARVTLLTTGLLLEKRADIVARSVDEIIISLDGPEAIHDRIRRVIRGFDLIRAGILAIRCHRPGISIQARSTVQRANFLFLRETVAAAKRLGFDSISFLATDVSSHAFNRELIWPGERQSEVALTRSEIACLEVEIELLLEQFRDEIARRYIVEPPEKLRHIVRRFREHLGELTPVSPVCNAPWVSAVMEVDGSIRPCFFHHKIGTVERGSLEDAVNSEEAQQFRRTLDVARNPTCQRCVCSLNYARLAEN
ncbi:radical SAM protein [Tunturibacter empetritectus]|uniref:MoaA/NifB/PqqE/SkfB family radical SAM enzyme n=2 Tax=Tunturiibacter empetritectus TaxID=3069691 RepID=A0A7W8IEA9_9BACT|nr:radical SAM protein [Edaphobacter lichenicola]MBB5315556.1 MoaA/NifB/PqqE/SkfB family radical SAM enzyme [Edaphobacter lichenicola]